MKRNKSILLFVAVMMLVVSLVLSGCGNTGNTNPPTETQKSTQAVSTEKTGDADIENPFTSQYSQVDLSKRYTINSYELGSAPEDLDRVTAEINKILEPEFNTTLKINLINWSDIATKYSLILASGENVDLVHSAPWNYYYTEAAKGAFMEITDDFLTKAMPQTKQTQVPESWEGTKINGKIYGVPMNKVSPETKFVAIRDDLRIKNNLPALTDWASYENFLVTIAKKETPQSGIYGIAASGGNAELMDVWMQQYEIMDSSLAFTGPFAYLYNGGAIPKDEDFFLLWDSPYMRDFVKRMQYLKENGCWSQDALSGTVSDDDAFANGQGASIAWNGSVYNYGKKCEENVKGAVVAYYDLTPSKIVNAENYNNNLMTIASASKDPDRAGMVLDLLKNHTPLYRLYVGGIDGVHYKSVDNKYREKGPEADKFAWDAFGWAIRRPDLEPNDRDPRHCGTKHVSPWTAGSPTASAPTRSRTTA